MTLTWLVPEQHNQYELMQNLGQKYNSAEIENWKSWDKSGQFYL